MGGNRESRGGVREDRGEGEREGDLLGALRPAHVPIGARGSALALISIILTAQTYMAQGGKKSRVFLLRRDAEIFDHGFDSVRHADVFTL